MKTEPRGFIALMSVLIISAVLMLIATGGSFSGFYGRQTALGLEFKEQTQSLAYACVNQALLALANDPTYTGQATTTVSGKSVCYVGPVTKVGTPPNDTYTFRTRAYLGTAYTSLSVVAKVSDLSVQSVTEAPMY